MSEPTVQEPEVKATSSAGDPDNANALYELLDVFEKASGGIQRDKGTQFETLIKKWLMVEPTYKDLFKEVLTYSEFATKYPDLTANARDTGIDLVGVNADDNLFTAIQCKFYAKDAQVNKKDIDSFAFASSFTIEKGIIDAALGAPTSDRERIRLYTRRLLVATNTNWSENARTSMALLDTPITLITREDLANSTVDWNIYLKKGDIKQVEKRKLRPYQEEAVKNVVGGFKTADRGSLIMACGTGKTFTALKIAEEQAGAGSLVLFMVPSLALLSQTLTDWKQQCETPIQAYAVCSDASTGKGDPNNDEEFAKASELSYPATTNADALVEKLTKALENKEAMTVVFSTYQSVEVLSETQKLALQKWKEENPGKEPDVKPLTFDLAICDEAHRTASGYYSQQDKQSKFTLIHSDENVSVKKRLYMTATPKVYGTEVKKQAEDQKGTQEEIILFSMDDKSIFGEPFYTLNFTTAVQMGMLVDYKVIILTVQDSSGESIADASNKEPDGSEGDDNKQKSDKGKSDLAIAAQGGLSITNATKVIGCWRALCKTDLKHEKAIEDDLQPMKRVVGFAQVINPTGKHDVAASKQFQAEFQNTINRYKQTQHCADMAKKYPIDKKFEDMTFATEHIDGKMNATEKARRLQWLREEPEEDQCKILFNVRCLSEGVDVPSLDAVMFLSPRESQVEVVQTVGRVMRRAPGKKRGYVIIPVVVPAGLPADEVLSNNDYFRTVWQVLKALKSIDSDFGSVIDGQLGYVNPFKIEVVAINDEGIAKKTKTSKSSASKKPKGSGPQGTQMSFALNGDCIKVEQIRSMMLKKLGNRKEWAEWAADVAIICEKQVKHIENVLDDPANTNTHKEFEKFTRELKDTLNGELSRKEILDMLGQHIVTKPVIDALFYNEELMKQNPISKAMSKMFDALDKDGMKNANELLDGFYKSVQARAKNIRTSEDLQVVIVELFDNFFKKAFPRLRDKLGIIYTPVEVVDFINQSVAYVLEKEFSTKIDDPGVHILDPFAGTGTFLTRLLTSGLISKDKIAEKYRNCLHAHEIVPLAYYISSLNIEREIKNLVPDLPYEPNPVMVWTDTFADHGAETLFASSLKENNSRLAKESDLDIRVILGNPPYSSGQSDMNEDNKNNRYEKLEERVQSTYTSASGRQGGKRSTFDSYILAYRWASDRIKEKGVVAFITNAGWIDSNSADGMRTCMTEEFNSIYIYHLKGNQRTSGERSRQEGGKIFDAGSRAPIAIVILVKNPEDPEKGKIYFHAIDDYLSRKEKLEKIREAGSIQNISWNQIEPDSYGDWLSQRSDSNSKFMPIGGAKDDQMNIFSLRSGGVVTSKDCFLYNSSKASLTATVKKMDIFFNKEVRRFIKEDPFGMKTEVIKRKNFEGKLLSWVRKEKGEFSWGGNSWRTPLWNGVEQIYREDILFKSIYRPFVKQNLYASPAYAHSLYSQRSIFPTPKTENLVICVNQSAKATDGFIALMTDKIADLHFNGDSQCFPRYIYSEAADAQVRTGPEQPDFFVPDQPKIAEDIGKNGYAREDAITNEALTHFQEVYPGTSITKDDIFYYIYGILHSPDYLKRYANNLGKELPRIPRVATSEQFKKFTDAGRELADLHVNFENADPYPGVKVTKKPGASVYVTQMKWGKISGKKGNDAKDKTRLIYNDDITIENIPLEAQEYVVNKKSALDWIVERCCYSVDSATGIVNDFNKFGEERGDPAYPMDLFLKVITVSLKTMEIVRSLPALEIHELDKQ